jgi:uncharacterized repeat protein (TIGR03803 family)
MKTRFRNRNGIRPSCSRPVAAGLRVGLWLALLCQAVGQTPTILHRFGGKDGSYPKAGLVQSGGVLYGTTYGGGLFTEGTVFRLNTDGSGFTNLYQFEPNYNSDSGGQPVAGLVLSGDTLYGTTLNGGSNNADAGTIFALTINGEDFKVVHSFSPTAADPFINAGGETPEAGLVMSGNTLFGTTFRGGSGGNGVIFRVNTDGSDFAVIHNFTATTNDPDLSADTNGDGAGPHGRLVLSGGVLFGTTTGGGGAGNGTVFSLATNGDNFTVLHSFTAFSDSGRTNQDGASPQAGLVLSAGTVYGTTANGGSGRYGTVFSVGTNGDDFTTLHSFSGGDGYSPAGALVLFGGALFGTTIDFGGGEYGTVFRIGTNGTGFATIHPFGGDSDGDDPEAGLVLSDNALFGTTRAGGATLGTVFSLVLPSAGPQLNLVVSDGQLTLSWPASAGGFVLQTNGDLTTANWNVYGGTITTNGGTENVTVTPQEGNLFFRLGK